MCGSSKRDVMYLTVSNSESDPEESDTALLCKRHYHLHVNLQIYNNILEGIITIKSSGGFVHPAWKCAQFIGA